MLADIIKLYFIFLCCSDICLKIMQYRNVSNFNHLALHGFSLILAGVAYVLKLNIAELTYIAPIIILWIVISFLTTEPQVAFIATTLAFGISYGFAALSSTIALLVIYPLHHDKNSFPYIILAIITAVFQILFTKGLFHIKRFRKGMPFLFSKTFINIATSLCLILIIFLIYTPSKDANLWLQIISLLLFALILALLIFWWQFQLTKSYKHALQLRELESLRIELQEKDKRIMELTQQNEQLGRLIHKDNKLIPAMENAVSEYLVSNFDNSDEVHKKGQSLLLQLHDLSSSRSNIISEIYGAKCKTYCTGVSSVDTLLNYMNKRASQNGLKLSVHIATDLNNYVPKIIDAGDLVHLLSDLLENAFIAAKNCTNRTIHLQIYQTEKTFIIEVSDSGIPFEIDSLVNLGLVPLTTHADTGGSGIGLLDIWSIKTKYGATLHITEYQNADPYSKKISLAFDKKNLYSITTWRKEEIQHASTRTDLTI